MSDPSFLISHRLHTHRLLGPPFPDPAAVVAHFGAVQGQDYLYSLWALGLRVAGATEPLIEQALVDRLLVRTWPMRTTLHYVTAADARWIVRLNAERTLRGAARRLRELELDDDTFARSRRAIEAALATGEPLTRPALYAALQAAGVSPAGQRGYYLMWYHANEGLIAIGPRLGKQQTVVLLDAWLPPTSERSRDEALAELAWRYFSSHGPALIKDYIWWSSLAAADARAGLELVKPRLASETLGKDTYWFAPPHVARVDYPRLDLSAAGDAGNQPALHSRSSSTAHLLPYLDEYIVAYRGRDAVQPPEFNALVESGNVIFHAPFLIDGRVAGIWTRKIKKDTVMITPTLFRPLAADEQDALTAAAERYGAFLGLSVELTRPHPPGALSDSGPVRLSRDGHPG